MIRRTKGNSRETTPAPIRSLGSDQMPLTRWLTRLIPLRPPVLTIDRDGRMSPYIAEGEQDLLS